MNNAQRSLFIEKRMTILMAIGLGSIEGGVLSALIQRQFSGVTSPLMLNMAVAVATGAPIFANLISFFWVYVSRAKDKIRFLVVLQGICPLGFLMVAAAPFNAAGLVLMLGGVILIRLLWCGVIMVRPTVWHANFPRRLRGHIAGWLIAAHSLVVFLVGAIVGFFLGRHPFSLRILYPLMAFLAMLSAILYAGQKMNNHRDLIRAEKEIPNPAHSFALFYKILRNDKAFRYYMILFFILGTANLMLMAPLIVMLHDKLGFALLPQIVMTSSLPMLVLALSMRFWARLLRKIHVIAFRAIHSWCFTASLALFTTGMILERSMLLWCGSIMLGVAYSGGSLSGYLGHGDFAPKEQLTEYMGLHTALSGLQGLIAPAAGVLLYEAVERLFPGRGAVMLLLPVLLSLLAASGFVFMHFQFDTKTGIQDPVS